MEEGRWWFESRRRADLNFFFFFPELAAKNLEKHVTGKTKNNTSTRLIASESEWLTHSLHRRVNRSHRPCGVANMLAFFGCCWNVYVYLNVCLLLFFLVENPRLHQIS